MAKITRKKTKSKSSSAVNLVMWKKITLIVLPVLALIFIINQSQGSVLGISDFVNNKANVTISPKPTGVCKPVKINSITFSNPCDEKLGFQKVTYTCADGNSSSLSSTKCGNPQELFEKVKKACNAKSNCRPSVTKAPRPTGSENKGKGSMQRSGQREENQQENDNEDQQ